MQLIILFTEIFHYNNNNKKIRNEFSVLFRLGGIY